MVTEQPYMLRNEAHSVSEKADEQTHYERTDDVHDERSKREAVAKRTDCPKIHDMAEGAADTGTKEHD